MENKFISILLSSKCGLLAEIYYTECELAVLS